MGGTQQYSGESLRNIHSNLGLNEANFVVVVDDATLALQQLGVPDQLIQEVVATLNSTRADVLNL